MLILSVENGADWVGHLQHQLDATYRKMPQEFTEHPVEVFRRNVYVNPFWEDDVADVIELCGVEHVLFGSDYPHPEGLAEPLDYLDTLRGAAARRHHDPPGHEHERQRAARRTDRRVSSMRPDRGVIAHSQAMLAFLTIDRGRRREAT